MVDKPVRLSALVSSRGELPFPAYGPDRLAPLERLSLGGLSTNHTGLRRRP
ncbi:hypothetical protein [Streptomyces doebereineriae]|uniref:hypothetical protein n=1 Tax=Streptomyces doebereineriae TaxID=3075528 RepID=UPI00288B4DFC|nr:hypothetical protein [Streptomyces sp. DSM 41640]